jgi:hypothetical protein
MQDAKTPQALAKLFQARFEGASDEQLQKFASGDDAGDAIAAGWETVCRSLLAAIANPPAPNPAIPHAIVHPDKGTMSHFLDIVDARTGGAPTLWKSAVSSFWSYSDKSAHAFSGVPGPLAPPAPSATVQRQGRNTLVIVDPLNQWTIPGQAGSQASAALTDGVAYVAAYNWPPGPFTVYAIDRKTSAVIWSSRVWAEDGFLVAVGGRGAGRMELKVSPGDAMKVSGDTLVVFGVAGEAAYIERFDLKTGENLSRFCTKYYSYDK